MTDQQTVLSVYEELVEGQPQNQYKPKDIQEIQLKQEEVSDILANLEGNLEVITSLKNYYESLPKHRGFPNVLRTECKSDIEVFSSRLDGFISSLNQFISRAKLLAGTIRDRRELVML